MTQSNSADPKQWTCDSIGSETELDKANSMSTGKKVFSIKQITFLNITLRRTAVQSDQHICTNREQVNTEIISSVFPTQRRMSQLLQSTQKGMTGHMFLVRVC